MNWLCRCAVLVAVSLGLLPAIGAAQTTTIVKPEFLLIVDTSGSMRTSTATVTMPTNSCGFPAIRINDAACVVQHVADGVGDAVFGMGTFSYVCSAMALANGSHYASGPNGSCGTGGAATGGGCISPGATLPTPWTAGNNYPYPFYGCYDAYAANVDIASTRAWELRTWGDGVWDSCSIVPTVPNRGGNEISNGDPAVVGTMPYGNGMAVSSTPLAGALVGALRYLNGSLAASGHPSPYINFDNTGMVDPYPACRPMNVILLTDGAETCTASVSLGAQGNARNIGCLRVDLNQNGVIENPIPNTDPNPVLRGKFESNVDNNNDGDCYDVGEQRAFRTRVYSIGFGIACPDTSIDAIAAAGGVPAHTVSGCAGTRSGYYATNEAEISAAINSIISQSALRELCNGLDDNCNTLIDEDFAVGPRAVACTVGTGVCQRAGTTVCNTTQDGVMCNATAGTPGIENTVALCSDGLDNDCDGRVDCMDSDCAATIVCTGACVPTAEICDGRDNNCNGLVDEGGIMRPCGLNLGVCTAGTETCQTQTAPGSGVGVWSACTGTTGTAETCNNLDDNCNGVTDEGLAQVCGSMIGSCRQGFQLCVAGAFGGSCIGEITATTEVCDGLDNNCNGMTDEGIPSMGSCGGGACGVGTLQCVMGSFRCVGGSTTSPEVCDGVDNDCNGATDENIPSALCTPPGVTFPTDPPRLPCQQGLTACVNGSTVCQNAVPPATEVCNGVDDDCNGLTDDGLPPGGQCGSMTGMCTVGTWQCVNGMMTCMGGTVARTEECNCMDDDCDGMTDEPPPGGSLCSGGAVCVAGPYCTCLRPCASGEFPCSAGTYCSTVGGMMLCVPDPCVGVTCNIGSQECRRSDGMCHDRCEGVTCMSGQVCSPRTGTCVVNGCRALQNCTQGQICVNNMCVPDPCAAVTCDADHYCANGMCVAFCTGVTCPMGQTCFQGTCMADPCAGVSCVSGQYCNPTTRMCVAGRCGSRGCPMGQTCDPPTGNCIDDPCAIVRCPASATCTGGQCVVAPGAARDRAIATGGGGLACTVRGAPGR